MNHLNITNFHNPNGGYVFQSKLVINNLLDRYSRFISKDISLKMYRDGSSYIFVLKIPSEKNYKYRENIFYDVIVEFFTAGVDKPEELKSIKDYSMRVFSNSPTFTFMFTYTYSKIDALYKKISIELYNKKALTDKPKITNPRAFLGIEKSIFYSLRKIYEVTGYHKDKIDKQIIDLGKNDINFKFPGDIFKDISSQEDKLQEIINVEKIRIKKVKANKSDRVKSVNIGKNKVIEDVDLNKNKLKSSLSNNKLNTTKLNSKLSNNNLFASKLNKK